MQEGEVDIAYSHSRKHFQLIGGYQAAEALIQYGALLVHDSRVSEDDNSVFLDLIEDYFAQPEAALKQDERPELGYQVRLRL